MSKRRGKKNPTPAAVLKAFNESFGNEKGAELLAIEIFDEKTRTMCKDREHPTQNCSAKHCPECGQHYRIMVFNYPDVCRELCRKAKANDHWPSRSSMIKESK